MDIEGYEARRTIKDGVFEAFDEIAQIEVIFKKKPVRTKEPSCLAALGACSGVGRYMGSHSYESETWLCIQKVNGQTMERKLRDGWRPSEECVTSIVLQILDTLGHLESAGVVHRDISPNNIIIDDEGRATLIDFGSACFVGEQDSPAFMVTDGFASPNTLNGHRALHSDDFYSLACCAYYALLYDALQNDPTMALVDCFNRQGNQKRAGAIDGDSPIVGFINKNLAYEAEERHASTMDAKCVLQPHPESNKSGRANHSLASIPWLTFGLLFVIGVCASAIIAYQLKPSPKSVTPPQGTPTTPEQITKVIQVENPKTQAQLVSAIVENRALKIIKGPKVQYRTRIVTKTVKAQPKEEKEKVWKLKYRTYEGGRN